MGDSSRIGIICKPDQPVFADVAERLRKSGYAVQFFDPRSEISRTQIDGLSLVVNKQVFPHAIAPLREARLAGTPLWNNLTATIAFGSRLVGLTALEGAGFRTPAISFEKPDGEYVAKDRFVWDGEPELNGDGDFFQERIQTEPVDYKYYAVDDGSHVQVAGRRVTSKLYGQKRFLSRARYRPAIAAQLRALVDAFDLRGVGVDLLRDTNGQFWAVDVNLAAGYRNTGLATALFESIRASARDQ